MALIDEVMYIKRRLRENLQVSEDQLIFLCFFKYASKIDPF